MRPSHRGGTGRGNGERGRSARFLDYGELRLLLLSLIAQEARHGYELMRTLEAQFGGAYSPSPGVIYPTLSWLEDMGFASVEETGKGRKRYAVTPLGQEFLDEQAPALAALRARPGRGGPPPDTPAPIVRAMENLKLALRLRFRGGLLSEADIRHIADAIDAAARAVEQGPAAP